MQELYRVFGDLVVGSELQAVHVGQEERRILQDLRYEPIRFSDLDGLVEDYEVLQVLRLEIRKKFSDLSYLLEGLEE